MLSPEINHLVTQEKLKDRLREIERQQFIQAAGFQNTTNPMLSRKTAKWLGGQMIKWGTKLQELDTPPAANRTTAKAR